MKYTIARVTKADTPPKMTLEEFCEEYDCGVFVEEELTGSYRYTARLTGIDVSNGTYLAITGENSGPDDPRTGGGATPEEAIVAYCSKLQGRIVTCSLKGCRIVMPILKIGELIPVELATDPPR